MSETELNCIFCSERISEPSNEHVFPSALGSKLKSTRLICGDCNNYFSRKESGDIDKEFVRQFDFIRNIFEIGGDRGQKPPTFRNVAQIDGQPINMAPGIKPKFFKVSREEYVDENGLTHIQVSAPDEKSAKQQIEHLKKQYGDRIQLTSSVRRQEPVQEKVKLELCFGGPDVDRAVLKILYEALFYAVRHKLVSVPIEPSDFDRLIQKVRYKAESPRIQATLDALNPHPLEIIAESLEHHLILVGDSQKKLLYGYVAAFSCVTFTAILSEEYEGEDYSFGFVIQPMTLQTKFLPSVSRVEFDPDLSRNYAENCEKLWPIMTKRIEALLGYYYRMDWEQWQKQTFGDEAFKAIWDSVMPETGEIIKPEHTNALVKEIMKRIEQRLIPQPREEGYILDLDDDDPPTNEASTEGEG